MGLVCTVALAAAAATSAADPAPGAQTAQSASGISTLGSTITGDDPRRPGFQPLRTGPGEAHVVRSGLGRPLKGRSKRRFSIVYVGQITDFQLADEESPTRVEQSFDPVVAEETFKGQSAWRPSEALIVHAIEMSIRQLNRFVRSPVAQGDGRHARMLNAVMTGDLADNQQRNETQWVVRLLDGGTLIPNSGSADVSSYSPFCQSLVAGGLLDPSDAPRYTGVQDYDDYYESPHYYDPERPIGQYAGWPRYPGLMDRAQRPFRAQGLKVPSYSVLGNHDVTVQGNEDANAGYEDVATGCLKPIGPVPSSTRVTDLITPEYLQGALTSNPQSVMAVPPDENRQFVDKRQFRAIHNTGRQADAHGFGYVDRKELAASHGAASYYSFSPKRGLRYIVLDTNGQGGYFLQSPDPRHEGALAADEDGNVDHPQWKWLEAELRKATERDELIVVFGHHSRDKMHYSIPDEEGGVPPCGENDEHGHDVNPGCDRDPRPSAPLHLGEELIELFKRYPHVVTYVAGHAHENQIQGYKSSRGGVWEIKSPAVADWPPQHRLIEVMDNRDGTLSVFGTMLDHSSPVRAPSSGAASAFSDETLASIQRTIAWNDPQLGPLYMDGSNPKRPAGARTDRNVELLVGDPRRNPLGSGGRRCANVRGRIRGKRLHRAVLGRTRRRIRRSYPSRRTVGSFDYFCLSDGKRVRVGYPTRKLGRRLGRRRVRRVRGRSVIILTNSRHFRLRRVRVGMRLRTMRRRLRGERRAHRGRGSRWWTVRARRATLIFRVKRGRVREIGIADRRLTRTRRGTRRLLRSYRGL